MTCIRFQKSYYTELGISNNVDILDDTDMGISLTKVPLSIVLPLGTAVTEHAA